MDSLGSRLKAARLSKRLSLRALATSIGVSPSLLSQIENGKSNPSVDTLYDLGRQLGISLDSLVGYDEPSAATGVEFRPQTDFVFQLSTDAPSLELESGVHWKRLAVIPGIDIEPIMVTYQPGASSSIEGKFMQHFGYEYLVLISGQLTLRLEFDSHSLQPGDSFAFDSKRPHLFVNSGDEPAQAFWYVCGRRGPAQQSPAFGSFAVPKFSEGLNSTVDVTHLFNEN